jgi:hypothetical protein
MDQVAPVEINEKKKKGVLFPALTPTSQQPQKGGTSFIFPLTTTTLCRSANCQQRRPEQMHQTQWNKCMHLLMASKKASIPSSFASVRNENEPLSPLSVKGNEENEEGPTQTPFDCLRL